MQTIRIGQFSQSPVLLAILHNHFLPDYEIQITNVVSSPALFGSLMKGELDIALTSPDNVLLYATTPKNPLGEICDVRALRSVDRGLNLSLVSTPEISKIQELRKATFSIDSPTSGFALLLNSMLKKLGIDFSEVDFTAAGSTPKRLVHMLEGSSQASILNAESKLDADEQGFRTWISVSDISDSYIGTVICVRRSLEKSDQVQDFLIACKQAIDWLLEVSLSQYLEMFGQESILGSETYFNLLHNPIHGLTKDNEFNLDSIQNLIEIRKESNAYAPDSENLSKLMVRDRPPSPSPRLIPPG